MIDHAMAVVKGMADADYGQPISPCEKLACRVLLPVLGKRAMVQFYNEYRSGNPLYRKSHLKLRYEAMVRELDQLRAAQGRR